MSTAAKRPLVEMRAAAERIVAELSPFCSRIEIAGSIRRMEPACGDIEIVAAPKFDRVPTPGDLFETRLVDRLHEYVLDRLDDDEDLRPRLDANDRQAIGPRYKRLSWCGVPVDLFAVLPPAQWGLIYLIRTGPADFSRRVVTIRSHGGWLPDHLCVEGGAIRHRDGGALVPTPEERDVFDVLGIPFVEPQGRIA